MNAKTTAVVLGVAGLMVVSASGAATAATLITGKNIKDGTVTSADIKNGTLKLADLSPGARVKGPAGPTGRTGQQGAPGVSGYRQVTALVTPVPSTTSTVACAAGEVPLSAGVKPVDADSTPGSNSFSYPTSSGWEWKWKNGDYTPVYLVVVCAKASS